MLFYSGKCFSKNMICCISDFGGASTHINWTYKYITSKSSGGSARKTHIKFKSESIVVFVIATSTKAETKSLFFPPITFFSVRVRLSSSKPLSRNSMWISFRQLNFLTVRAFFVSLLLGRWDFISFRGTMSRFLYILSVITI